MHPSPSELVEVIRTLIMKWNWTKFLVLYETNDGKHYKGKPSYSQALFR